MLGNPGVGAFGKGVGNRHAVNPRKAPPEWQLSGNLVHGIRPNIHPPSGSDEPHAGIEVALGYLREPLVKARCRTRQELEPPPSITRADALNLITAEATVSVVHHDGAMPIIGHFMHLLDTLAVPHGGKRPGHATIIGP